MGLAAKKEIQKDENEIFVGGKRKHFVKGKQYTIEQLYNHKLNKHKIDMLTIYKRVDGIKNITFNNLFKVDKADEIFISKKRNVILYLIEGKKFTIDELFNLSINIHELDRSALRARILSNPDINLKDLFREKYKSLKQYRVGNKDYTMSDLINHPLNKHKLSRDVIYYRIYNGEIKSLKDLFREKYTWR